MRLALVLSLVFLVGCASIQQPNAATDLRAKAIQTVIAATDVYDILMISLGSLYQAKLLGSTIEENNRNRDTAVQLANAYRNAALKVAAGIEGEEMESAIKTMQGALAMLRQILSRFNVGALDQMQREVDSLREVA